jgi:hypothetical protein
MITSQRPSIEPTRRYGTTFNDRSGGFRDHRNLHPHRLKYGNGTSHPNLISHGNSRLEHRARIRSSSGPVAVLGPPSGVVEPAGSGVLTVAVIAALL